MASFATVVEMPLAQFVRALAAKQPTPGGGGSAAVAAAVGEATAHIAAACRRARRTGVGRGRPRALGAALGEPTATLAVADADAAAYGALQASWKDDAMSADASGGRRGALAVPVGLVRPRTPRSR